LRSWLRPILSSWSGRCKRGWRRGRESYFLSRQEIWHRSTELLRFPIFSNLEPPSQ
jgi:hypothetical protein